MKRRIVKSALIAGVVIWAADLAYKLVKDISYINREQCVLFRALPRLGFVLFEYFFETLLVVFVGVFVAVWVSRHFARLGRFLPRNPLTGFVYGALAPICSCGVIPVVSSLRGKLGFSTLMAFVLAAPLLSPYTIVISFTVLGPVYGGLRIVSAFVLTMVCVAVLGVFERRLGAWARVPAPAIGALGALDDRAYALPAVSAPGAVGTGLAVRAALAGTRCDRRCPGTQDIYLDTLRVFTGLVPYLVIAGAMGVGLEYLGPRAFLMRGGFGSGPLEVAIWTLIGVPLYFCNGAEVLFLRPLVSHGFPVGTAIAFSLASTAICITSVAMLFKVIGARLTLLLTACVAASSVGIALLINWAL